MSDAPPLVQSPEYAALMQHIGVEARYHGPHLLVSRRIAGVPVTLASRVVIGDAAPLPRLGHPLILNAETAPPRRVARRALRVLTPAWVAELDLSEPPPTRRARMHQKWRNRLRHAEAQPLVLRHAQMPADPDHWLLQAETQQRQARSYRGWPTALTCAYVQLHPRKTHLLTAIEAGKPVAAMLFFRHGNAATYHIGHSTARGRQLSAHHRLLWQAADHLARKGVRRLDLGLIDTETNPGLARFKLGSGATARPLGGTWLCWPSLLRGPCDTATPVRA
ncbi:MAG: GNAT family N-acetyltransferase [Marinibacterium sp.]|nr:GNAT family N-acetyltransferase [Marinibacterium sp.]